MNGPGTDAGQFVRDGWSPDHPAVLALGPLAITFHGMTSRVGGPQQQLVLAFLLQASGISVPIERIIDGLWGIDPPTSARGTVHAYVSNIRRALGDVIQWDGNGYTLQVTPDNFDVLRFEALVSSARVLVEGDPARAVGMIRSALALWRGDPYAGLLDCPTLHGEAVRLEELRLCALGDCIDAELRLGKHRILVAELEPLAADHGLRERFVAQLMVALYRCGRQADALDVYRRASELLENELGLGPSQSLRRLREQILAQSLALTDPGYPPI